MNKIVHVVHCVDTEGPIYEDLDAKFDRLETLFGLSGFERTEEGFERLRRGEVEGHFNKDLVKRAFSDHLSNYKSDWDAVNHMLRELMSSSFRMRFTDSLGGPYVFNWFCLDMVGCTVNPRRRTLGYHAVFDRYRQLVSQHAEVGDGIHWHFHPMSIYREAHRNATSLLNSPHIWETLARRIIERNWFPSCVRAGFLAERPDTHWFLEQYIPFDLSNIAAEDESELQGQADLDHGRCADWRLAPKTWTVYHPSHDCYQLPGDCRRWIGRALNVLNRFSNLDAREAEKAFAQAQAGQPTLLGIGSHDYRDLVAEAQHVHALLLEAQRKYEDVHFKFCEAREAFLAVAYPGVVPPPFELSVELHRDVGGQPSLLTIDTRAGKVFGPQPFLAIKTRSQRFIHDNLDFGTDLKSWRYVFDADSVRPDDVEAIGIGANDQFGSTWVKVIECSVRSEVVASAGSI